MLREEEFCWDLLDLFGMDSAESAFIRSDKDSVFIWSKISSGLSSAKDGPSDYSITVEWKMIGVQEPGESSWCGGCGEKALPESSLQRRRSQATVRRTVKMTYVSLNTPRIATSQLLFSFHTRILWNYCTIFCLLVCWA